MGPDILVAILVPLGAFALVLGMFFLRSRENMALIERGINPRQNNPKPKPFINLKYGLLLVGAGLGLLAAFLIDSMTIHTGTTANGTTYEKEIEAVYFALIAIGGGIGLIISYRIEKKEWLDKRNDGGE